MRLAEKDIPVSGISLHIYRTNTSKTPMVFAHGMSDNGLCFLPIAEHFSDKYEIVLFDSRNHGKSEATKKTNLMDRAKDLAALIEELKLDKPILVGHSLGAVTAAVCAGLFPEIPGCVILEDPPPFEVLAAQDEEAKSFKDEWRALAAANKQKTVQELMEIGRQENPSWPEEELFPWAQSKQQFNLYAFDEEEIDPGLGNQVISNITCPLLLVTGNREKGSIYGAEAADKLVSELPNAQHVNIPDAGHNIRRDQPAEYLKAVLEFLEIYEESYSG